MRTIFSRNPEESIDWFANELPKSDEFVSQTTSKKRKSQNVKRSRNTFVREEAIPKSLTTCR
jgi:hypothetical protein